MINCSTFVEIHIFCEVLIRLELLGSFCCKLNLVAVYVVDEHWQVIVLHEVENAVGQLVLSHFTVDLGVEIRLGRCDDRLSN